MKFIREERGNCHEGQGSYGDPRASQKRQREGQLSLRLQEETGEGCFKQKFIGGEREFKAVAVSHQLPVVAGALLLEQGGLFLLILKIRR